MRRALPLLLAFAASLVTSPAFAEDFVLSRNGLGPIKIHTVLSYENKGEKLVATATNETSAAIPYVKFCVNSETKRCLFELWNTETWEPGRC